MLHGFFADLLETLLLFLCKVVVFCLIFCVQFLPLRRWGEKRLHAHNALFDREVKGEEKKMRIGRAM
jgi:hypothetical protein